MNSVSSIFIVDDDAAVRDSLMFLIKTAGFNVSAYASAEAFLESYIPEQPGCLILDLNMPGMSGPDLQAELVKRNHELPIIFLTGYGDIPATVRAMQAGAFNFLTKPVKPQLLIELIQLAILEDIRQRHSLHKGVKKGLASLTPREQEIAILLTQGCSNKEIAHQLGISHRTVENHRARVMEKTGAANLIELLRFIENQPI
ncbi:MAG: response regulator [Methylomonas sp.]|jgi:RNA polymerase sigma factor (sigma-70 family)